MSERKNNGVSIRIESTGFIGFVCDTLDCGFNPLINDTEKTGCIHEIKRYVCSSKEAQSDAMNRAAAAINEEQARRVNEAQSTEEIVERSR